MVTVQGFSTVLDECLAWRRKKRQPQPKAIPSIHAALTWERDRPMHRPGQIQRAPGHDDFEPKLKT